MEYINLRKFKPGSTLTLTRVQKILTWEILTSENFNMGSENFNPGSENINLGNINLGEF